MLHRIHMAETAGCDGSARSWFHTSLRAEIAMPYVTTNDGVALYYKSWGAGRPVILIHGWPLDADSWDPQAMALAAAGFHAIAYDRRGFGRSDQPWDGYGYDSLTDDLSAVMAHAGVDSDITLVGFSVGGGEVARYMRRHRGRGVVKAVLISSVVPYMLKTDDNPKGVPQENFDEIMKGIRSDRAHFFQQIFFPQFFGTGLVSRPVSDELLAACTGIALLAGLKSTLACVESFSRTDFRNDLNAFDVPTLIIHGTADKIVPIAAAGRAAANGITGSKLIEYDDEPNGLFATASNRLTKDLLAFLAT